MHTNMSSLFCCRFACREEMVTILQPGITYMHFHGSLIWRKRNNSCVLTYLYDTHTQIRLVYPVAPEKLTGVSHRHTAESQLGRKIPDDTAVMSHIRLLIWASNTIWRSCPFLFSCNMIIKRILSECWQEPKCTRIMITFKSW